MHWGLQWALWLVAGVLAAVLASAVTLRSWHHFARRARGRPGFALGHDGPATPLDQIFAAAARPGGGRHGVMTLLDNAEAYAARAHAARQAGRSLDIMTYIWRGDLTGRLLLADVLAAADRGVRVRLLLDDIYVQGLDPMFLAVNAHRNVEVRLFNPIRNRGHVLRRGLEAVLGLTRYNRRLHCKAWIADGRLAITGGRNIGDTYFGRSGEGPSGQAFSLAYRRLSRDADLALAGPVVAEVARVFDGYWNLGLVLPIAALWPGLRVKTARLRQHLARLAAGEAGRAFLAETLGSTDAATALTGRMRWTDRVQVLADPPDKMQGRREAPWMADQVQAVLAAARQELCLVTPYFVPGAEGLADLTRLAQRGVAVSVLTNGLAASDNIFVHGAYRRYRSGLMRAGARVFEFAPPAAPDRGREVLHAKVFLVDARQAIVGSLNFDLRSAQTNAEMGILFQEPELVAELMAAFQADSAPGRAHAVVLQGRHLQWSLDRAGLPKTSWVEPEASLARRALSWCFGLLPIDSWL